jgi:hypothetical protein
MARASWSLRSRFVPRFSLSTCFLVGALVLGASACSTRSGSVLLDAGDTLVCHELAQLGPSVPIKIVPASLLVLPSSPPPDGTRIEGQFVLSALTVYVAGAAVAGDSSVALRQTLEFQGDQLRSVTTGVDGEIRFVGSYQIRSGALSRSDTCHSQDAGADEARIQVDPSSVVLITASGRGDDARTAVSVYQRLDRDR